jgi:hypothetical protein
VALYKVPLKIGYLVALCKAPLKIGVLAALLKAPLKIGFSLHYIIKCWASNALDSSTSP